MSDYTTLQKRRNLIVGGFVIIAFCAFLWLIFIFGELPVYVSKFRSFSILVKFDQAPGIQKNTMVQYCGYQVGKVTHISPPIRVIDEETGRSSHIIEVSLALERRYHDIPSNCKVIIMKRSMGSSYIELQIDLDQPLAALDPDRPETMFLVDEMVLSGTTGSSSEFLPKETQEKIETLVDSISKLADNINTIVGDEQNQANLKKTLANVTVMSEEATKTLKSIKKFSDTGSKSIGEVSEHLNEALTEMNELVYKINNGKGTAAMLVNDGRLYENLLDSSEELQIALRELKMVVIDFREKEIISEKGLRIKF